MGAILKQAGLRFMRATSLLLAAFLLKEAVSFKDKPNISDLERDADNKKTVVLHADDLRQLRWMDVSQLKAIFNGRRGQFKVESSPAAYQELRWMSTAQIEAIFGTKDIPTA